MNLAQNTDEVTELTCKLNQIQDHDDEKKNIFFLFHRSANTITALFFTHSVTKFIYVALNSEKIYRTLGIWNQSNTHPLFAESDAR